jgi:sugar phosphate isomerase/epimerase
VRLGVADGPLPFDPALVDGRVAAKIRDLGFSGVSSHLGYGSGASPDDFDSAVWARVREVLGTFGLRVVHSWAWDASLMHSDVDRRRRELFRIGGALQVAKELGADGIVIGSGGHNPRGPFWPHRDNHTRDSRDCLIANLREAAVLAEDSGLVIALEGHVMTALDTAEHIREVLEAVDSPAVRLNADPVNLVGDLAGLWNSTAVIDQMFDLLGPFIVSGHVKDIYAEERLVVHLSETVPGDGEFDLRTYLRRFESCVPDAYLFIEHLPEDLVPQAKRHLDSLIDELAIPIQGVLF